MASTAGKAARLLELKRPSPAMLAAAGFVAIQVGLGVIFKLAQSQDNKYAFSQSASVTISEFLKLCLSAAFFYQQCWKRKKEELATDTEKQAYVTLKNMSDEDLIENEKKEKSASHRDSLQDSGSATPNAKDSLSLQDSERPAWLQSDPNKQPSRIGFLEFVNLVSEEVQIHTVFGMAQLALFYVIINNVIFCLFRLADPGTISLIRSGVTLVTALNLRITTGQLISRKQWAAIIFQICGVMVTQYKPGQGTLYPFSTYLLIVTLTVVSAVSGVYNQILLKSEAGSLHVCNMSLYAAGTMCNLILHVLSRMFREHEPSFFEGYGSFGAIMVIMFNVFIGLAITAVYKYADALIKCFATAVSTGILLYIAPLIFHVPLTFLVIPGSITVFAATWLYVDSPSSKKSTPPQWQDAKVDGSASRSCPGQTKAFIDKLGPKGRLRQMGLAFTLSLTILIVVSIDQFTSRSQIVIKPEVPIVESPFKDALGFVRWNQHLPERIPIIEEYRPFFKEMHYSMPMYLNYTVQENETSHYSEPNSFNDLTGDNSEYPNWIYITVAQTMQNILDAPENSTEAKLTGLFYFHFDAWVDPLSFTTEDPKKIWFPDGMNPRFECIMGPGEYGGWGPFNPPWAEHDKASAASKEVYGLVDSASRDRLIKGQFCLGWSDIYYIPRHLFKDYIYLARIFLKHAVFHEVAIATMVHTIDVLRRSNPRAVHEVLTHIGDCWGSCCDKNPSEMDVSWHRCGHQLDMRNENVTRKFFDSLDESARMLGKPHYNYTSERSLSKAETVIDAGRVKDILKLPVTQDKLVYPIEPK